MKPMYTIYWVEFQCLFWFRLYDRPHIALSLAQPDIKYYGNVQEPFHRKVDYGGIIYDGIIFFRCLASMTNF